MKVLASTSISLLLLLVTWTIGIHGQGPTKPVCTILLDNTGTLRPDLDNVKMAGKALATRLYGHAEISIINFASKQIKDKSIAGPILGVDWTQDLGTVTRHINTLTTQVGQTALFDAIQFSGEKLRSRTGVERKVILVTDGQDRISRTKQKDLILFLVDNQIRVYAIGLIEGLKSEAFEPGTQKKAKDFLLKITHETGGRVVFPKEKQTVSGVLDELLG